MLVGLASCEVTGPDEAPWQRVADFSWKMVPGDTLIRFAYINTTVADSVQIYDCAESNQMYGTQKMLQLRKRDKGSDIDYTVNGDTLVIDGKIPARFALTGPLVIGHSWDCTFDDDERTQASWHATINNRYRFRNIHGTVYEHVLEVEYKPLREPQKSETHSWLCFYAKGIGLVDIRCNKLIDDGKVETPIQAGEFERYVLLVP